MTRDSNTYAIENAWRIFIGLMIFAAAVVGLVLVYNAFFAGINKQWPVATAYLMMSSALIGAMFWLIHHRSELIGSAH
jgi:hypothetical protein